MEVVKLTIDGREVEVPAGISVLEAAERYGIHIPRLCYDPDLSAAGACRLCVVEIQGMRNLPASCVTTVAAGMVVNTATPAVLDARRTILELLIANHPMDCLTCEKFGDCKLADYCYQYGVGAVSRFPGERHSYPLEDNNPYILRDLNKCILCGKCVRACAEITGKNILDFAYRGFRMKVAPFGDLSYADAGCIFCGNCLAYCPTGALVERKMRGKGRRWDMQRVTTTCTFCGAGCNFDFLMRDGRIVGVASNPDSPVNGRTLCIRGRFATVDFIYSQERLTTPLVRREGKLEPASWEEALDLVAGRLAEIRERFGGDAFAALGSARCTNEENYLLQKFARLVMGTNNVDHYARNCHAARGCEDAFCEPMAAEVPGVTLLRCQNNEQGASDMGVLPGVLPGYQRVGDDTARYRFEDAWKGQLPARDGLSLKGMLEAAREGSLKAMFILGEDPLQAGPVSELAREALGKLELLVVQDLFLTGTAELADVVLPAASFAETDGTFTNTRRRIQRVRKAIEPLPGVANWEVLMALSRKLGYPMDYASPEEIFAEMATLTPLFADFTYGRIEAGGLQWP